jgi:hypothetical protein
MSYSFNKTHNINLYYDIFELLPPADLLRAVPDFSDPLMITSGNPDLKPENMHLFFLSYMHTDPTNFSTFSAMINCNIGQDRLATSTIYSLRDTTLQNGINLAPGARYSTWKNVNGAYMFGAALNYSIPWDFIKSNLNCGVSYNINKNVSILNETENYTNNQNINFQFGLKTNISTDFSINLNTENKLIQGFNSLSNSITQKYFNQMTRINFLWNVSYDFIYTTDLNYLYNGILTGEKNPNIYYLDCGLSRKLFSQNQGEIRFAVYDIFDNSNSYSRVITGSFYQETRRNSLGRYYVFSFKYSLRNF